ncbi:MAG: cupin domain-containing protein [Candidatus Binataceae bacterium]
MKMKVVVLALLALALSASLHADQIPVVTATPILSTRTTASGQPIDVPVHPEVVVSRLEIAPHGAIPMHKHPYPRYAYVLSGNLEITVPGGTVYRYKTGDFIAEVINQWHIGRNAGDTPVRLLVIDQVVPGHSNTVYRAEGATPAPRL